MLFSDLRGLVSPRWRPVRRVRRDRAVKAEAVLRVVDGALGTALAEPVGRRALAATLRLLAGQTHRHPHRALDDLAVDELCGEKLECRPVGRPLPLERDRQTIRAAINLRDDEWSFPAVGALSGVRTAPEAIQRLMRLLKLHANWRRDLPRDDLTKDRSVTLHSWSLDIFGKGSGKNRSARDGSGTRAYCQG